MKTQIKNIWQKVWPVFKPVIRRIWKSLKGKIDECWNWLKRNWLYLFCCIISLGFVISAAYVVCQTFNNDFTFRSHPSPANCAVKLEYVQLSDSLGENVRGIYVDSAYVHRIDKVLHTVEQNQTQIVKRQDDLVADLRQEANNTIEKTTAWVSFWITVMAFVGTLIPALLSVWTHRRDEATMQRVEKEIENGKEEISENLSHINDEFIEKKNETTSKIRELNDQFRDKKTELNELEVKLSKEIENKKKALDKFQVDIQSNIERQQLELSVIGLINGLDAKLLDTVPNSYEIKKEIFDGIINKFSSIVKSLETNPDFEYSLDKRELLTSSLISLYTAIHNIQHHTAKLNNTLKCNKCLDQIRHILTTMYDMNSGSSILNHNKVTLSDPKIFSSLRRLLIDLHHLTI